MANLVLYKNISDNNKINKDITFIDERQCTFKDMIILALETLAETNGN